MYRFRQLCSFLKQSWVRAKGSDQNRTIATYFASTVTVAISNVESKKRKDLRNSVVCSGKHSIYEVLMACLPSIVRSPKDVNLENRKGLTEIEFFKSLVKCGYVPLRRRASSEISEEKKARWRKEWRCRRWVDLTDIEDVFHVERRLSHLREFPEARAVSFSLVSDAMSTIMTYPPIPTLSRNGIWHECLAVNNSDLRPPGPPYPKLTLTGETSSPGGIVCVKNSNNSKQIKMFTEASYDSESHTNDTCASPKDHVHALPYQMIEKNIFKENEAILEAETHPSVSAEAWLASKYCDAAGGHHPMLARHDAETNPIDEVGPTFDSETQTPANPTSAARRSRSKPERPAAPLRSHHRVSTRTAYTAHEPAKAEATKPRDRAKVTLDVPPPESPLLRLASRHGWANSAEMRRLCTFGYDLRPVWQLLAALHPRLRAFLASCPGGNGYAAAAYAAIVTGSAASDDGSRYRSGWDEARAVFFYAEERARWAMEEEDTGTGYLEIDFDPATQCRTSVFLTTRYAAQRGAARPALLAAFASHAVPLSAASVDFLAATLHAAALRRLGAADCTQYLRVAGPAGRPALVREDSRTRFDAAGRVVKVCCRHLDWAFTAIFIATLSAAADGLSPYANGVVRSLELERGFGLWVSQAEREESVRLVRKVITLEAKSERALESKTSLKTLNDTEGARASGLT